MSGTASRDASLAALKRMAGEWRDWRHSHSRRGAMSLLRGGMGEVYRADDLELDGGAGRGARANSDDPDDPRLFLAAACRRW